MKISEREKEGLTSLLADINISYKRAETEMFKLMPTGCDTADYYIINAIGSMFMWLKHDIDVLASVMDIDKTEIERMEDVKSRWGEEIDVLKYDIANPSKIGVDISIPDISEEIETYGEGKPMSAASVSDTKLKKPNSNRAKARRKLKKSTANAEKSKKPRGRPRKVKK